MALLPMRKMFLHPLTNIFLQLLRRFSGNMKAGSHILIIYHAPYQIALSSASATTLCRKHNNGLELKESMWTKQYSS